MKKNSFKTVSVLAMVIITILFSACPDGSTGIKIRPPWLNAVSESYTQASYVPDLDDVMPEAVSDTLPGAGQNAGRSVIDRYSFAPFNEPGDFALSVSDLRGSYVFAKHCEDILDMFSGMGVFIDNIKREALKNLDQVEEHDEWTAASGFEVLFSEADGVTNFYTARTHYSFTDAGGIYRTKAVLHPDGKTELYSRHELPISGIDTYELFYSVCLGNDFTYYRIKKDTVQLHIEYINFTETDDEKTGQFVYFLEDQNSSRIWLKSFNGNDSELVMYSHEELEFPGHVMWKQSLTTMADGIAFALDNISGDGEDPKPAFTLDIQAIDGLQTIRGFSLLDGYMQYRIDDLVMEDETELPQAINHNGKTIQSFIDRGWEWADENSTFERTGPFTAMLMSAVSDEDISDGIFTIFPEELPINPAIKQRFDALNYTENYAGMSSYLGNWRVPGIDTEITLANAPTLLDAFREHILTHEDDVFDFVLK